MTPVTALDIVRKYRPDSKIKYNGNWLIHSCIIDEFDPHHSHGDVTPSAGINIRTGAYNCFTYSDHALSFKEFCKIVGRRYDFEDNSSRSDDFEEILRKSFEIDKIDTRLSIDIYSDAIHPYLTKNRRLSEDVIRKAGLRYDQYSGRIVIPIYDDGILVGIQKRRIQSPSIDGRFYQKYENNKGFDKSAHLYHIEQLDIDKPLLVVESVMSVLKAWDYGLKNACALFGSRLSRAQADKLKSFSQILWWTDGDAPGRKVIKRAIKELDGSTMFIVDSSQYGSSDIADLPFDISKQLIAKCKTPMQWLLSN